MLRFWRALAPHWGRISAAAYIICLVAIIAAALLWSGIPSDLGTFLIYPGTFFFKAMVVVFLVCLAVSLIGVLLAGWYNGGCLERILAFVPGLVVIIFVLALVGPVIGSNPIYQTYGTLRDGAVSYHVAWYAANTDSGGFSTGKLAVYRCAFLDFDCKQLVLYPEDRWINRPYLPTITQQGDSIEIIATMPGSTTETWATFSMNGNLLVLRYGDETVYVGEVD